MPKVFDLSDPANVHDVSVKQLQNYVTRYSEERHTHLLQKISDDSKQVHIKRNLLEEFLKRNAKAEGVRMYYGVVDEKHEAFKHGIHNVIMVPTKVVNGQNKDMLDDHDSVIVTHNMHADGNENDVVRICPPGPPCEGSLIS